MDTKHLLRVKNGFMSYYNKILNFPYINCNIYDFYDVYSYNVGI